MQEFIARQNIAHFKSLLEVESDPDKRRRLQELLADERLKLADVATQKLSRSTPGDSRESDQA